MISVMPKKRDTEMLVLSRLERGERERFTHLLEILKTLLLHTSLRRALHPPGVTLDPLSKALYVGIRQQDTRDKRALRTIRKPNRKAFSLLTHSPRPSIFPQHIDTIRSQVVRRISEDRTINGGEK